MIAFNYIGKIGNTLVLILLPSYNPIAIEVSVGGIIW